MEGPFDRQRETGPAHHRQRRHQEAQRASEHRADHGERERMAHDRARVPHRIDAADRTRLPHLMAQQLGGRLLEARVADRERRQRHAEAAVAHRLADCVVVGETVGEGFEAADLLQRLPAQRNSRPETRLRHPDAAGEHDIRQEIRVDRHRGELRPDASARDPMVETSHGADAGLLQLRHHIGEVARPDLDVAVRHDDDVVAGERGHVDQVGDLAIAAIGARIDGELDRGVGAVLRAEYDLHRRAVALAAIGEKAEQQVRLATAERLEDGDGGLGLASAREDVPQAQDQGSRQKRKYAADRGSRHAELRNPLQQGIAYQQKRPQSAPRTIATAPGPKLARSWDTASPRHEKAAGCHPKTSLSAWLFTYFGVEGCSGPPLMAGNERPAMGSPLWNRLACRPCATPYWNRALMYSGSNRPRPTLSKP